MDESMRKTIQEKVGDFKELEKLDDTFRFTCKACGRCCMNRENQDSILIFPRDMFLALQTNKNLEKEQFIEKHFEFHIGSGSGLPVCTLKNKVLIDGSSICTFLKKREGKYRCSIHANKPAACRSFPLGRVGDTNNDTFTYILQTQVGCNLDIPENEKDEHTVSKWIPDKADAERAFMQFNKFIDELTDIINMRAVMDSHRLVLKHSTDVVALMGLIKQCLYYEYDIEKDFFEQFERNTDAIKMLCQTFVDKFSTIDKNIKPKKK